MLLTNNLNHNKADGYIEDPTYEYLKKLVSKHSAHLYDHELSVIFQDLMYAFKSAYQMKYDAGNISDGYHTFNELYHHRAILFKVICNSHPELAWKSKQHHDPNQPMYDGMFIVGIETPEGQATYHYDVDPYWDMFKVKELDRAPEWDGHTPDEAIRRIGLLG